MILHIRMIYYGKHLLWIAVCHGKPLPQPSQHQMDGGLRPGDCAAAAFVIGLWSQTSKYEPWFLHGTFLHSSCSVFASEAIALDEASEKLEHLLKDVVYTRRRRFLEHRTADSYCRSYDFI